MYYKISNLKMPITLSHEEVFDAVKQRLAIKGAVSFRVLRKSIDARRGTVSFVYTLLAETEQTVAADGKTVTRYTPPEETPLSIGTKPLPCRPVVVGFGPCGMFCALTLARLGYRPLVLERGADVDTRTKRVQSFWTSADFDPCTNVQFGEGGAGTFSDGKLTTRIGDRRLDGILQDLVHFGAPEDILYSAMPHIGTDILTQVVKNIREEILALGGEVRFLTQLTDISVKNGALTEITLSDDAKLPCSLLVLAIGHSARDTYEMLFLRGAEMEQKPFSVGVRAEHLQKEIDRAMYGSFAGHPALGAAPYKLSYREGDRGCYSFCMCPGGSVVNASSEEGHLVTNGMSDRARKETNANSAICVSVSGTDFESAHPLAGVAFQRTLEKLAFCAGGGNYCAPVQRLGDFLEGKITKAPGTVAPTFLPGTRFADFNTLFPPVINRMLKNGFGAFEKKIKGFANPDTLLTGIETRTSAPVRIMRNDALQATKIQGLFPAGEGAGYAGGIMSAAADGIRIAEEIIKTYAPK